MTNNYDNFQWAHRLQCPESAITESVKKSLHQGISSLLWDEIANVLHPAEEALTVRKNILLYKLKHGEKDSSLQRIENIAKLRTARASLDPEIETLEEKCKEQDFLVRQKHQQLSRIKSRRDYLKMKEELLRMKLTEMKTQVEDCKEMHSVCRHLMPANNCQIDYNIVDDSLALVSTIATRADRKMVLNKISDSLDTIEISTLWNILLSKRTRDTEELMELGTREIVNRHVKSGESMDISISKARGRYIVTAIQEQIYCARDTELEERVVEHIEKIEALEMNNMYVSEWLALTLEVRKLETEQKCLETEIDNLKKILEQQFSLSDELSNLESDIHSIHTRMENCMQDIQKSLILLNRAGPEIARTREELFAVLTRIVGLRSQKQNTDYLDIDLSTELNTFHDSVDLEAFSKIVLKDNVGAYRHTKFCMSEAYRTPIAASDSDTTLQFPVMRAPPVYELLNCYKNLMRASLLTKLENESTPAENYELEKWTSPSTEDSSNEAIDILDTTDLTFDRIREEIRQFNLIFDAWKYQTVQKAMTLDDRIVNGASFKEWVKRYDIMLHMIRQKK